MLKLFRHILVLFATLALSEALSQAQSRTSISIETATTTTVESCFVPDCVPDTTSLTAAQDSLCAACQKTVIALKTNLLYDAATALNAEIELPVGERFSILIDDIFPWWNWGPNGNKYCFQLWEMGIEPRWWFGHRPARKVRQADEGCAAAPGQTVTCADKAVRRDRLTGHFIGLYAMSGRYDFQNVRELCYQGEDWSVGLTYGYALPVGRRLNMEFSASVGYLQSDYRHYVPDTDYSALYRDHSNTGRLSYFGPTKLKVSIALPFTSHRKGSGTSDRYGAASADVQTAVTVNTTKKRRDR